MNKPAFSAAALREFEALYPEQPGVIEHDLVGHPLFELGALAELASRMDAANVEYNCGDLPIGVDPAATPANGLSIAETIRSIETCGSWMVLKLIEQDPVYRDFLHKTLAELQPVTGPVTGEMFKMEGFVFISSPDAVTPFHFDPEHNILLQLRGTKTMTVFPAGDETLASGERHEAFAFGGHRNLDWQDSFAAKGQPFQLQPGKAIHVPVKAPHWVKNGPEPSISLSITWRSEWSNHEAHARSFNAMLRRAGMTPTPPKRYPARNLAKSVAYRAVAKATRPLKGQPE